MNKLRKKAQEGFTLVEILIVVVIIGILASVAIPTYLDYVKRSYAADANVQLKNIVENAEIYLQENGSPPSDIQTMQDEGYLNLKTSTLNKWSFELDLTESDGLMTGTITATSLSGMKGGEGHMVSFDLESGEFTGYGQRKSQ